MNTVLILGATGRFGRNAGEAFEKAGWRVRRFDRKTDTLDHAARGVDVIVQAWNPAYQDWEKQVMAMQPAVHKAALDNDATVIIPGNVYVFGAQTPSPWSHTSPYQASNILGRIRIEMENSYRKAGVKTIVLRAGDYIDTLPSGNWFDMIMAKKLGKGVFTYPGRSDIEHAWGYLPDVARAAVLLAEKRDQLERFTDVNFPGYTLSGQQLVELIARIRGHEVRLKPFSYLPIIALKPFVKMFRHLDEMKYLWTTPHRLDGTLFNALLPGFEHTPVEVALAKATAFAPQPQNAPQHATA